MIGHLIKMQNYHINFHVSFSKLIKKRMTMKDNYEKDQSFSDCRFIY